MAARFPGAGDPCREGLGRTCVGRRSREYPVPRARDRWMPYRAVGRRFRTGRTAISISWLTARPGMRSLSGGFW